MHARMSLLRGGAIAACSAIFSPGVLTGAEGDQYQSIIDSSVADGVPGIQAYVRKGQSSWTGAAGLSSIEQGRRMSASDRIRLASITKMMTYAAVMELVKEGQLQVSDQVQKHLPAGALEGIPHASEFTVAHLLEHKSGLHNFNGNDGEDFFQDLFGDPSWGTRVWKATELVGYARNSRHQPTSRPGEKTAYSSTGYIVLEMMLEHLEQKPFHVILRERLFAPLGMSSAGVEGADFSADQIIDSYARPAAGDLVGASPFRGGRVRNDGLVNLSAGLKHYNAWARGAGAVAASVEDLAKFMEAVESGRITVLSEQPRQFEESKRKPGRRFSWNGGAQGIQASILYEPARELTVIILKNASNAGRSSNDIAKQLLAAAQET